MTVRIGRKRDEQVIGVGDRMAALLGQNQASLKAFHFLWRPISRAVPVDSNLWAGVYLGLPLLSVAAMRLRTQRGLTARPPLQ